MKKDSQNQGHGNPFCPPDEVCWPPNLSGASVVRRGIFSFSEFTPKPTDQEELRKFRFSRMGEEGSPVDEELLKALANAMTADPKQSVFTDKANRVPAGFIYLGQFIEHDLSFDKTQYAPNENITVAELIQGRSPALDLDCLYGRGPDNAEDAKFYSDGIRLKVGVTTATNFSGAHTDMDGFDLPRAGVGSTKRERRAAVIPDPRNDENLAVAQIHLAFIRFHNQVVDTLAKTGTPSADLFNTARELVIKHYQWMIRHDFLPRIADPAIVDDVFTKGRKFFEPQPLPVGNMPTMPIEFFIAAYRLDGSMILQEHQWNRFFNSKEKTCATLELLMRLSGVSGNLSEDGDLTDPNSGLERLPTHGIADFRRLFDFSEAGQDDLQVDEKKFNFFAARIDTLLAAPLKELPSGSVDEDGATLAEQRNPAFHNLMDARTVKLASGQQMATMMEMTPLTLEQILNGAGGADLSSLTQEQKNELVTNTPLWFYILREAEINDGRLAGVGARIVAEVFHRAIEGSQISILRNPSWKSSFGADSNTFCMADLLFFAFQGKVELLNPLGD